MDGKQKTEFPLPPNLPRPVDDGAARHLVGTPIPAIALESTIGGNIDLGNLPSARTVIFCYPMTGKPGTPLPEGWDAIPGARGCTPQACAFRDLHREFGRFNAKVLGLSTQSTEYQSEMAKRLELPYPVLSDARFELCNALRLPTFEAHGTRLVKRLTLVIRKGQIEHVFYPVFPSSENAGNVLRWLDEHPI